MRQRLQERSATTQNGCIIYTGQRVVYGQIEYRRHTYLVHRVAWQLVHGNIPDGLCVCHTCDTPLCINVGHLFLGTHRDNTADMIRKGRAKYSPRTKLTQAQVDDIRALIRSGKKQKAIAASFGISQSAVSMIGNAVRWS